MMGEVTLENCSEAPLVILVTGRFMTQEEQCLREANRM